MKPFKPPEFAKAIPPGFWFFLLTAIAFSLWMAGQYPGFYIDDTFYDIENAPTGRLSSWHSYIYSAFINLAFSLSKNLSAAGYFQILLFSFFAAYCFSLPSHYGQKLKLSWLLFFPFILSPINGAFSIFYNRDPLFSWLFVFFLVLLFQVVLQKRSEKTASFMQLLTLCLLSAVLVAFRKDFFPVVLFWPFFVLDLKKLSWRSASQFSIILLTFHLLTLSFIPWVLGVELLQPRYRLTAALNPLAYIVKHGGDDVIERLPPRHRDNIERIAHFGILKSVQDDFEIPAFHARLVRQDFSENEFNKFARSYLVIVLQNPKLFLENRIRLFLRMMGVTGSEWKWTDKLGPGAEMNPHFVKLIEGHKLVKRPLSTTLQQFQNKISDDILYNRYGFLPKWLLFSCLPGFILLVSGLFLFPWLRAYGTVCFLLLLRTSVVFLTAPASQFKYIYSLYLFGFIAPLLILAEMRSKKKSNEGLPG